MTDERMVLLELAEKEADADLVREMLAFAAERPMKLEVKAVTIRAMLVSVIGRSLGSWLKAANSTIADAPRWPPRLHRSRAAKFHHVRRH